MRFNICSEGTLGRNSRSNGLPTCGNLRPSVPDKLLKWCLVLQAVADEITAAVADVRTALDGEDPNAIKEKISDLQKATMKIGEAMQGSNEQQAAPESEQQTAGEEKKE